jgi:hypothetical protein
LRDRVAEQTCPGSQWGDGRDETLFESTVVYRQLKRYDHFLVKATCYHSRRCTHGARLDVDVLIGGIVMGDKGSKDKGKKEQQKKAKLTPKEKRKAKQDKKQ